MAVHKPQTPATRSQRPRARTVFAAAFLAGAAAAVGVNRSLEVHLAQRTPRVESEPIFVALRTLPQGAPVTVWDVALRDWPKAMLPAAAMRPRDSFEGMVVRHPVREGQPILSVQLAKADAASDTHLADVAPAQTTSGDQGSQTDLWAPAELPAATPAGESAGDTASLTRDAATPPIAALEPTLAEPLEGEPASPASSSVAADSERAESVLVESVAVAVESPAAEPVVAEPVVVAPPSVADVESPQAGEIAPVAQPRPVIARYLVVPERIALEADRSFVPPAPLAAEPVAKPEATATPATATATNPAAQRSRATTSSKRTSYREPQGPRPPRSASSQPVRGAEAGSGWSLRSMLPSLSLGMGAVESQPSASGEQAGSPRQPAQPGGRRPGLFR